MSENKPCSAVVLSGGGAKGAFEIGIMKALFEGKSQSTNGRPLSADVFTGTSVGAYNAAFMTAQPDIPDAEALAHLERIWLERIANTSDSCGNGVFELRGLPLQGFDPNCLRYPVESFTNWIKSSAYLTQATLGRTVALATSGKPLPYQALEFVDIGLLFSSQPLRELIASTVDLKSLGRSAKELTIAATNWKSGRLQLYSKEDISGRVGHPAILASAAIPGIFDPVVIEGQPYVDGGLSMNTPLAPAIRHGATDIHVIYLDPVVANIPLPSIPSTVESFNRMLLILSGKNFRQDFINVRLAARTLRSTGTRRQLALPTAGSIPAILSRFRKDPSYRLRAIHRYRPPNDLGGGVGLLDFSADNIRHLIELGYKEAQAHDCSRLECLTADPS